MSNEKIKSFLRDVTVNIVGVLLAAILSLGTALWIYNHQNQKQFKKILDMIIYENELNEQRCQNILERLNEFVWDEDIVKGKIFVIRLLSQISSMASESELVARYCPLPLRTEIIIHCENIKTVNSNLDNFNDYLKANIDDKKLDTGFLKDWVSILVQGIKNRCHDSKLLTNKLSQYIKKN